MIKKALLLSLLVVPVLAMAKPKNIDDLFQQTDVQGIVNNGLFMDGKTIHGYKFDVCVHENTRINYCESNNAKRLLNAAQKSKNLKFLGKYNVVTLDSKDKITTSFALVDTKAKKVITSGLEYNRGGKLRYSTTGDNVLSINTTITNGFNYAGGSRSHHSDDDKSDFHRFTFNEQEPTGQQFDLYGPY